MEVYATVLHAKNTKPFPIAENKRFQTYKVKYAA